MFLSLLLTNSNVHSPLMETHPHQGHPLLARSDLQCPLPGLFHTDVDPVRLAAGKMGSGRSGGGERNGDGGGRREKYWLWFYES